MFEEEKYLCFTLLLYANHSQFVSKRYFFLPKEADLGSGLACPGWDFSGDPGIQDPTKSLNLTGNLLGITKGYSP